MATSNTTPKTFALGSVSTGTMRPEDLIVALSNTLAIMEAERSTLTCEVGEFVLSEDWPAGENIPEDRMEEAQQFVEDLFDALNEICPPFVYFGAHPGNGSDYGFWPDIESLEDERRYARTVNVFNGSDWYEYEYLEDANVFVHVNDHGNVTLLANVDSHPGYVIWDCV